MFFKTNYYYQWTFIKKALLFMKITTIFIFMTFLSVSGEGLAQKGMFSTTNVEPGHVVKAWPAEPVSIIAGTVKDAEGNPLAGVSVVVSGTQKDKYRSQW